MIDNSVEWLAALFDSGIVQFGTRKGQNCIDCGTAILIGSVQSKRCGPCKKIKFEQSTSQYKHGEIREYKMTCSRCEAPLTHKLQKYCRECAKQVQRDRANRYNALHRNRNFKREYSTRPKNMNRDYKSEYARRKAKQ